MKTFEEAIDLIFVGVNAESPEAAMEAGEEAAKRLSAAAEGFDDVMQEALDHPKTEAMIAAQLSLIHDGMCPHCALRTAFANGIRVGMEMERQTLDEGSKSD